jgi:hypothetical protein
MSALGRPPNFSTVQVQSSSLITTLPQPGAPVIVPAAVGQNFVAYDTYAGYYLVFVSGKEVPQTNLPDGGEFHWDGWLPAANVAVMPGTPQLEVDGVFPGRLNIRNAPGTSGTTVIARTIDGKRYVPTGGTASADGFTWREVYIASQGSSTTTGWAIADNLTVFGSAQPSRPTITTPRLIGTVFTVSATTQLGFRYVLEFKNALTDASWSPIETKAGTGGLILLKDTTATASSRLYRVRVQ